MTCEHYDRDLALYVEGELSAKAAGVLERHLQQCQRCQAFLRSLEVSQRGLRAFASEPLDDAALAAVRVRVLTEVTSDALQTVPSRRWVWALAAGLVLLASTVVVLRRSVPPRLSSATGTAVSVPTLQPEATAEAMRPARTASDRTARASRRRSTTRGILSVSPDMGPQDSEQGAALTAEEADQLARAVVIVSRVERVSEPPAGTAAKRPLAEVVQLATADPDVVIYWQIDSSGG
jgi:anti-sigma factor RsiW